MSLDRQQCILSSLENIKEQDDEIQETGNADQMACHDDKEETSPYQCMATQSDDANYQEEEIDGFNEEEQIHTVKKSMVQSAAFTERSAHKQQSSFKDDLVNAFTEKRPHKENFSIPISPKQELLLNSQDIKEKTS